MGILSIAAFADELTSIMPVVMKEFARKMNKFNGTITLPQFLVMEYLARRGQVNMKLLAEFMRVTTAAMTGIVARLVREGYVRRVYDSEDRRIIKVRLTVKGVTFVRKTHEQRRALLIKIFGKISEVDRQDYLRILTQIKEIIERENK